MFVSFLACCWHPTDSNDIVKNFQAWNISFKNPLRDWNEGSDSVHLSCAASQVKADLQELADLAATAEEVSGWLGFR